MDTQLEIIGAIQRREQHDAIAVAKFDDQLTVIFNAYPFGQFRLYFATYVMNLKTEELLFADPKLSFLTGRSNAYLEKHFKPRSDGIWAKADQKIFNEEILIGLVALMEAIPADKRLYHCLRFNHRLAISDGSSITVLHRIFVLGYDTAGAPDIILGILENIDGMSSDGRISAWLENFEEKKEEDRQIPQLIGNYSTFKYEGELNKREFEVLELIAQGMPSKLIADQLHISIKTVDRHKENIRVKTKTRNVAEMAVYAAKHGIC